MPAKFICFSFGKPHIAAAVCTAALLAGSASTAMAQAASTPTAAPDGSGVQEIVVTADRRSELKKDVPIAIEAFSADQLETSGVTNVGDLGTITPGLEMGNQGGYVQPRLRGVGTLAVSPGVENPIAVYVDGIYYAAMPGSLLSLANIQSVEVDKGPQGTLFGRNATGGLIQINTLDPKSDFQGAASVTYGDYNTAGTDLYATGGVTDNLSANLSVHFQNQGDGYGKNAFTGEDVNKTQDLAIRNKWLLKATDDTQIKLVLDYAATNYSPAYVPAPGTTPLGGPPYTGSPQGLDGYYQPYGVTHQGGISLQIDHDFSFAHFVSTTAYRQTSTDASFDGALTPDYNFALNLELFESHKQISQEFQLQSQADSSIKWVTGVYLFDADAGWQPLSVYGGLLAPFSVSNTYSDQRSYSAAVFGQATKEIFADTNLTMGLRYTAERRVFRGSGLLGFPDGSIIFAGSDAETVDFEKPTWRISLDHHFTPDLMGYISYNRGFKSGGFNDSLLPTVAFAPEVLDDYEIGVKADYFSHRLRLDLAGFFYNYKNLQEVRYPDGIEDIFNAPSAEIYGIDFDVKAVPVTNLVVTAGLEVLHDSYTSFPDAPYSTPAVGGGTNYTTFSAAGNRLPQTPDWTFDFALDYDIPTEIGDFRLNATYSYNDGWYAEADNRLRQAPYSLINSQVSWNSADEVYTVAVWGRNLLNTQYLTALDSQANGDFGQYAPPRTFGVTLKRSF